MEQAGGVRLEARGLKSDWGWRPAARRGGTPAANGDGE